MHFTPISILVAVLTAATGAHAWLPGEHRDIFAQDGTNLFAPRRPAASGGLTHRSLPTDYRNVQNAIRGVNLGSLFIIENWMADDVFAGWGCNSSSEFDCVLSLDDQNKADHLFQGHWDSWITRDDFKQMVEYGLNTVRIPVGYWFLESIVDKSEHFARGGDKYLDRLVGWAKDAGIYVIISLHGAPGAQTTNPFTGQVNPRPAFYNQYNYNRAYRWLDWMTTKIHTNANYSTVGMLELVNEPEQLYKTDEYPNVTANVHSMRQMYYPTAWSTIRAREEALDVAPDDQINIMMMDATWGSGDPTQYLPDNSSFAAFDSHNYVKYANVLGTKGAYLEHYCNKTGPSDSNQPLVVGEWSLAVADNIQSTREWHPSGNTAFYRQLWAVQVTTYETISRGWVFWSWKTSGSLNDPRWDYRMAVDAGIIDKNTTKAYDMAVCSQGAIPATSGDSTTGPSALLLWLAAILHASSSITLGSDHTPAFSPPSE